MSSSVRGIVSSAACTTGVIAVWTSGRRERTRWLKTGEGYQSSQKLCGDGYPGTTGHTLCQGPCRAGARRSSRPGEAIYGRMRHQFEALIGSREIQPTLAAAHLL